MLGRGRLKYGSTWLGVVEEEGGFVGWRFVKGLDKLHTVVAEALMIQKHSLLGCGEIVVRGVVDCSAVGCMCVMRARRVVRVKGLA